MFRWRLLRLCHLPLLPAPWPGLEATSKAVIGPGKSAGAAALVLEKRLAGSLVPCAVSSISPCAAPSILPSPFSSIFPGPAPPIRGEHGAKTDPQEEPRFFQSNALHVPSPHMLSPHILSPRFLSPHILSPHILAPHTAAPEPVGVVDRSVQPGQHSTSLRTMEAPGPQRLPSNGPAPAPPIPGHVVSVAPEKQPCPAPPIPGQNGASADVLRMMGAPQHLPSNRIKFSPGVCQPLKKTLSGQNSTLLRMMEAPWPEMLASKGHWDPYVEKGKQSASTDCLPLWPQGSKPPCLPFWTLQEPMQHRRQRPECVRLVHFLNLSSTSSSSQNGAPSVKKQMHGGHQQRQQEAARKQLLYLVALVTAMVGLSYAAVPLYRMFCQATGFGGTTQRKETVEQRLGRPRQRGHGEGATPKSSSSSSSAGAGGGEAEEAQNVDKVAEAAARRQLVIHFNADVADGLPWKFTPCQRELRLHPGQSTLAFYTAQNKSNEAITGVSTYNVAPMKAGVYFNKIQCFCFEEQRLQPGEKIDMPVFFYIDPEFAVDRNMDDITNLTLSYTFFKVDP